MEFGLNNTEALRGMLAGWRWNTDAGVGGVGCGRDMGRNTEPSWDADAGASVGAGAEWPLLATPGEETEFPSDDESLAVTLKLLARFLGT